MIIKQGDLFPDVEETVKDENGAVVDITGSTVKFSMRKSRDPSTAPLASVNATLVDGPTGKIAYQWQSGNTDVAGTYEAEFRVTPSSGDAFRVPTDGYIVVIIEEKVG